MVKGFCLAAAIFAMAVPAFADDVCGPVPIGPAIPSAGDEAVKPVATARADIVAAYRQVLAFQAALKSYRVCLRQQDATDNAALAQAKDKKDDVKISDLTGALSDRRKTYDSSVDAESEVAKDFNTLHIAHCTRDSDPGVCPPKQ